MLHRVLSMFSLACRHRHTSQPFAAASARLARVSSDWEPVAPAGQHYVVCLDCGKKFDYDWKEMRIHWS